MADGKGGSGAAGDGRGRRGGTRGVADGGWLSRLDGQKERKRGVAQPARPLRGWWTKLEERGVGVGFLAWHRGIDTRRWEPAPPTPPTPYVIAPRTTVTHPPRSAQLLSDSTLLPLSPR